MKLPTSYLRRRTKGRSQANRRVHTAKERGSRQNVGVYEPPLNVSSQKTLHCRGTYLGEINRLKVLGRARGPPIRNAP